MIKNFTIKNKGFVLPVGLIILLITTLIVLLAASSNLTQDKIISASQDRNNASQNADKALRVAENYIYKNLDGTYIYTSTCDGGLCTNSINNIWNTIDWVNDTTHTFQLTGTDTINDAIIQPKYIIEALDSVSNTLGESNKAQNKNNGIAFRITAVGWGKNASSKVMLQSIYVKSNI